MLNLLADLKGQFGLTPTLFIESRSRRGGGGVRPGSPCSISARWWKVGPAVEIFANPRHPYTKLLADSAPVVGRALKAPEGRETELPDPENPPEGCAFRARCPRATALCAAEVPPLTGRGRAVTRPPATTRSRPDAARSLSAVRAALRQSTDLRPPPSGPRPRPRSRCHGDGSGRSRHPHGPLPGWRASGRAGNRIRAMGQGPFFRGDEIAGCRSGVFVHRDVDEGHVGRSRIISPGNGRVRQLPRAEGGRGGADLPLGLQFTSPAFSSLGPALPGRSRGTPARRR